MQERETQDLKEKNIQDLKKLKKIIQDLESQGADTLEIRREFNRIVNIMQSQKTKNDPETQDETYN